jgi:hypothetical protein
MHRGGAGGDNGQRKYAGEDDGESPPRMAAPLRIRRHLAYPPQPETPLS